MDRSCHLASAVVGSQIQKQQQAMKKTQLQLLTSLLALATAVLFLCSGCKTAEQKAQKHLAKAISLDPNIVKSKTKDSTRLIDSLVVRDSVRIKDSINVQTRDSVIIIPKSDLGGSVPNPCDGTGKLASFDYTFGSGSHKLRIWSDGATLRFSSSVDSLISRISTQETYVQQLRDSLRTLQHTRDSTKTVATNDVVTIVPSNNPFRLFFLGLGCILVGFLVGRFVRIFT